MLILPSGTNFSAFGSASPRADANALLIASGMDTAIQSGGSESATNNRIQHISTPKLDSNIHK